MSFPYYAVVRLVGDKTSKSMTFEANNLTDALNEMARKAGVPSTHELDSYILYEVIENGDGYKPVAEKWDEAKRTERMNKRLGVAIKQAVIEQQDSSLPVVAHTVVTPTVIPTDTSGDPEYESYEVEVA